MILLKPSGWLHSGSIFFFSSAAIHSGLYCAIPFFLSRGFAFLPSYFISFYTPFVIIFALSIALYRIDGGVFAIECFASRFRLKRLSFRNVLLAVLVLLFCLLMYFFLLSSGLAVASFSIFSPPDFFPAELNPLKPKADGGFFMDYPMSGNWWILTVYLAGWFFNIFGEEFLFRGYLLPRMELRWPKSAWLINALMWWLWHFFWRWNLIALIPSSFIIPYVVYKTKNTWMGIIIHGGMNLIPVFYLAAGVCGFIR